MPVIPMATGSDQTSPLSDRPQASPTNLMMAAATISDLAKAPGPKDKRPTKKGAVR